MKKIITKSLGTIAATTIIVGQLLLLPTVKADWNPGDPAKWVQLPDLQNGFDVLDTWNPALPYNKILADDFMCTQTGPITSIHIWGSWLNNRLPRDSFGKPIPPIFDLSFHLDVPAGVDPTMPWSHPGPQVWDMVLQPQQVRLYSSNVTERFFDPNQNAIIGTDTEVWQYNFQIPVASAFFQTQSNIYWLNVQVQPEPLADPNGPFVFGWKTSTNHWNDDAVYGDNFTLSQPPPVWFPLQDPTSPIHQSLDLAFVLDTIPEPSSLTLVGFGTLAGLMWRRHARRF